MSGRKIFAAIVLAVLMPVAGALLVYQVALGLSYGPGEIVLLLKGLASVFATALAVIFIVVFCGSLKKGTASGTGNPRNSFEGRSKMIKTNKHLLAIALLLVLAQRTRAASVESVRAQQRPKSNIVDVYYDLVEPDGGLFDVSLSIEGGEDRPAMVTLKGDVGIDLTPGRNKHIEWDAGTDWPNRVQSNFVATVKATPSIGMVLIPGGTNSGSDPTYGSYSLSVNSFYMDRTEVSYMRWKAVYDWAVKHGYAFDNEGGSKGMDHPVQKVNWYDCVKWCNARSEMNNREPVYRVGGEVYRSGQADPSANLACDGYRLPTDEEWEYAARGGRVGLNFPWGNTINHDRANYLNSGTWYPVIESSAASFTYHPSYKSGAMPYTAPVASFPANDYGLYDVVGNVREWTGAAAGAAKLRGGSWGTNGKICCLGDRTGTVEPATVNYSNGFRAVRSR